MEFRNEKKIDERFEFANFEAVRDTDEVTERRLESLLARNAEYEKQNSIYRSEKERFEADLMETPLSAEKTFSYFGLLLGTFPPAAFFGRLLFEKGLGNIEGWVFFLLLLVNIVAATTGYFSGKMIGKAVVKLEQYRWWEMLFIMPFLGLLWGIVSGGTAGAFILIIGAFFGAFFGGAVGIVALPCFAIFHRLLKRGDKMDGKEFFPIAFGITLTISALILGFPV